MKLADHLGSLGLEHVADSERTPNPSIPTNEDHRQPAELQVTRLPLDVGGDQQLAVTHQRAPAHADRLTGDASSHSVTGDREEIDGARQVQPSLTCCCDDRRGDRML